MTASFFRPECLEPPVVLKLRLQRFTIGHFLELCEMDSPYRPDAPRCDAAGVGFMFAVFVCSQTPGKARADIARWWFRLFFVLWSWLCRHLEPKDEMRKFRDYINAAISGPDVTPKGQSKTSECPRVYCLLRFLMQDMHQSFTEAAAMPLDRAMNLWAAYAEKEVGINAWDERREELWNYAQEQAKLKGGGNGSG